MLKLIQFARVLRHFNYKDYQMHGMINLSVNLHYKFSPILHSCRNISGYPDNHHCRPGDCMYNTKEVRSAGNTMSLISIKFRSCLIYEIYMK